MINISKVISFSFDALKRQIIKVYRLGSIDVQEAIQGAPFGIDSSPVKDMQAIFMQTGEKGKTVIVGYLNRDHISEKGETRIYSTSESGEVQIFLHLKNDGTAEFGGDADNLVRYSPLNSELQAFKNALAAELGLIAAGIATGGGAYTPGALSIDISGAKIDEIKTL
jgi:hypothetical protein